MTPAAFREIIVPLDLVAPCDTVLQPASVLARHVGVGVRLVTVSSPGLDHSADEVALHAHASRFGLVSVGMRPRPAALRRALGSEAIAVAHATRAAVLAVPIVPGGETNGDT